MDKTLVFRKGYLITDANLNCLDDSRLIATDWRHSEIGEFILYSHPDTEVCQYRYNGIELAVCGIILDPFNGVWGMDVLEKLAQNFMRSEERFFDYLDTLSGRFVLLLVSAERAFILQDATGNQTLFYDRNGVGFLASSHAEIIAELCHYRVSDEGQMLMRMTGYKKKLGYFPGLTTCYDEIAKLLPNTLLDVRKREIRRFFPREALQYGDVTEELVAEIAQLFLRQIELLKGRYKLAVSVTGGLDSRVTLAATKKMKEGIFYYTFLCNGNHKNDVEIAGKLCQEIGVEHHVLQGSKADMNDDFKAIFDKNTSGMSIAYRSVLAKVLYDQYPQGYLHLKSNISEICRAYFRNRYFLLPDRPAVEHLAALYGVKTDYTVRAFKEFVNQTDFTPEALKQYDIYDMFYWENKMGGWQGLALLEVNNVQDVYILYNNRSILKKMLGVRLNDRKNACLYHAVIAKLAPDLTNIPINPWKKENWLEESAKRLIRATRLRL